MSAVWSARRRRCPICLQIVRMAWNVRPRDAADGRAIWRCEQCREVPLTEAEQATITTTAR